MKYELNARYTFAIKDQSRRKTMDQDDKFWEDYDFCYECGGYGDDYHFNKDTGELECNCPKCPYNPVKEEDDETD